MKTSMIVLMGAVTFISLAPPVLAEPVSDTDPVQRDLDVTQMRHTSGLGDLRRANEIIGTDIKDARGAKLGTVRDLGLDLQNGRIVEVIIATHAETSLPDKFTALPPESFVCEGPPMTLRLIADRAQIASAPTVDFSHWNEATGNAQLLAVYARFGADPYFTNGAQPAAAPDIAQGQVTNNYTFPNQTRLVELGHVARASKLMGTTAWNIQGQKLARVDNFVVDLPKGRVVEVILGQGGFLGMHRQLTAIPPQAFRLSKDNTLLGLDTTQEALDSAPHFKAGDWKMANQPDRVTAAYALFNINPYFIKSDANSGAENVRARAANSPTARANQADMDATAQIRKAIAANDQLSADAKNVNIVTSDGQVTITGAVRSDDEKRQIGEAAAKVVSAEKVDNKLDVQTTPISTPDQ